MKPKKLSFVGGKPAIIDYAERPRADYNRAYNQQREINETEYVKFYHSTAWKHMRQEILERDFGLCQRCGHDAALVDHIVPSKDDWEHRLDPDNLESLCRDCHRIKTKREWMHKHKGGKRYMQINIVCGLPGAGKSTYVQRHLGEHDLVYDYDDLMQALSGLPSRHRNPAVHDYIMSYFDLMLRKLRSEQAFDNVWIIRTLPDPRLDSLLTNYHQLRHILIATDPKVCEQRLQARGQEIAFNSILNSFKSADFTGYRTIKGS